MSKLPPPTRPGHLPHIGGPAEFSTAFGVSREVVEKLELYAALLQTWQRAVNLVAFSTLEDVWHRHFADSAQLLGFAPTSKSWIDLGSGGGFPGLVIAILFANQENRVVHLGDRPQGAGWNG
jgi:16S rRNA (guanine527-N7)-methyltransferase